MNAKRVNRFFCRGCRDFRKKRSEPPVCGVCGRSLNRIPYWKCDACGAYHDYQAPANSCCGGTHALPANP
jgi:predicted amidophosphoribosyltransferase